MGEPYSSEALAEKYLTAVDHFCDAVLSVPPDRLDFRNSPDSWSSREIAFHAAEVDQNLGVRLRRLLTEDHPVLAGVNLQGWVNALRPAQLDVALAIDSLRASSAINVALIETLEPSSLRRMGRHSEGHDVSVQGLCLYMALHLESHVRQLAPVRTAWQRQDLHGTA